MADIPLQVQDSPTVRAIYAAYEKRQDQPRRYLGASTIGTECARKLWYNFRWCGPEKFSGRMLRLFQTGHLEEVRFAADLAAIGATVHLTNPATGQQFGFTALGGHFGGHMDGCVIGLPEAPQTWHVLEGKTHNAKSFRALQNHGVKKAKPEHESQMQIYMHLSGMDRALYLATNKDTDELYAERVKLDTGEALRLLAKARAIVEAKEPPERIADAPDKFPCMWCHHKERCHGTAPTIAPHAVNCRTCACSTPIIDNSEGGRWICEKYGRPISEQEQRRGCEKHLFIPALVNGLPVDGDTDFVRYEASFPVADVMQMDTDINRYQVSFANGHKPGEYTSEELALAPADSTFELIDKVKRDLGGAIIDAQ